MSCVSSCWLLVLPRSTVFPGDTLLFRVELLAPIRRGISTMKGYVFVGEKVVCEAEFMAQIVKNK